MPDLADTELAVGRELEKGREYEGTRIVTRLYKGKWSRDESLLRADVHLADEALVEAYALIREQAEENKRLDSMLRDACRRWAACANFPRTVPDRLYVANAGEGYQALARSQEAAS